MFGKLRLTGVEVLCMEDGMKERRGHSGCFANGTCVKEL
jgi:hypothetical protein